MMLAFPVESRISVFSIPFPWDVPILLGVRRHERMLFSKQSSQNGFILL